MQVEYMNGSDFSRCDVLVAVVDGIPDQTIDGLSSNRVVVEQSMIPADGDEPDAHGTEIFSLILADGPDYKGVAPGCHGISLPVFFNRGTKPAYTSQMDLARAVNVAIQRGADIINISAGQISSSPEAGRHLEDAIIQAEQKGILVVAATGNDGCECLHVPAANRHVLAVGAMDSDGVPHDRSNWGKAYHQNGILAPGVDIDVVTTGRERCRRTGTSYAAAVVSGVAAQLLCKAKEKNYPLGPLDIRSILYESSTPCNADLDGGCERILIGRLNIKAAQKLLHERGRHAAPSKIESSSEAINTPSPPSTTSAHSPNQGRTIMTTPTNTQSDAVAEPAALVQSAAPLEAEATAAPMNTSSLPQAPSSALDTDGGASTTPASGNLQQSSAQAVPDAPSPSTSLVTQSACGCSGGKSPQMAFAIGNIWYDFGTEARFDAISQAIGDPAALGDPAKLFKFLEDNLEYAAGVTFILMQDQIPVYAVHPAGPYAQDISRALLDALKNAIKKDGHMLRVSLAGMVAGTTRLMNGATIPVLYPDLRGMMQWDNAQLLKSVESAVGKEDFDADGVTNFLVRVYDELRNLGLSPEERAINFAATNAYQVSESLSDAATRGLELYSIDVAKSPICRPDSDCWDVELKMFDPENERRAGRVYRFIIDVSEVLPVTVGQVRTWSKPVSGF